MPLLWFRSLISTCRMKLRYFARLMRNELSFRLTPWVEPTITPSLTDHKRGSPSHPSRFFALNNGRKPGSAAGIEPRKSRTAITRFIYLRPLNLDRVYLNFLERPILRIARRLGNALHHLEALRHLSEYTMAVIQPWRWRHGDEKLAAVRIGSGIGHRQYAGLGVFELGVKFIGEFVARSAAAGAFRISSLDHEIGDHAVEDGAIIKRLTGLAPIR